MAIAQWIQAVRTGRPMRVLGAPDRTRDLTDVHDVVTGLLRLADGNVQGRVNLGTGTAHRLAIIAQAIAAALGRPAGLVVEAAHPEDVAHTLVDTGRCQTVLGMTRAPTLDSLVRHQVAASRALPDGHGVPRRRYPARCHPAAIEATEPLKLNATSTTVGARSGGRR